MCPEDIFQRVSLVGDHKKIQKLDSPEFQEKITRRWIHNFKMNNNKDHAHLGYGNVFKRKEGDLTQSYDKTPYTNRKFENQWTTQTRH